MKGRNSGDNRSVYPQPTAEGSDHVWSIEEIVRLLPEPKVGPSGPYRKRAD